MENVRDYELNILRKWYKKQGDTDVKSSLTLRLRTLGGYVILTPLKQSYGSLCRFAVSHPEMIVDVNKDNPTVVVPKA